VLDRAIADAVLDRVNIYVNNAFFVPDRIKLSRGGAVPTHERG